MYILECENMNRKSCEERIDEELKSRMEDIKAIVEAEDPIEELNNRALALSRTVVYKLEFSWGGPQDYFEFEYDPEAKELIEVRYYFLDWFDGASRTIRRGTKEFELLERLFYETILIE